MLLNAHTIKWPTGLNGQRSSSIRLQLDLTTDYYVYIICLTFNWPDIICLFSVPWLYSVSTKGSLWSKQTYYIVNCSVDIIILHLWGEAFYRVQRALIAYDKGLAYNACIVRAIKGKDSERMLQQTAP